MKLTDEQILSIGKRRTDNLIFNYYYPILSVKYDSTVASDSIRIALMQFDASKYTITPEKQYNSLGALFNAYLYKIAEGTYVDTLRTNAFKKNQIKPLEYLTDASNNNLNEIPDVVYDDSYVIERKKELENILDTYFPAIEQGIVLRRLEGVPFKDIAKHYDMPTSTAKAKFSRAIVKIKLIKDGKYNKGNIYKEGNYYIAKANKKYIGLFPTRSKAQAAINNMLYNIKK